MQKALYYTKTNNLSVQCSLCPHLCIIPEGKKGICKVRVNKKGMLYSSVYGKLIASHMDPIEKKPLYHFYPGKNILSIGTNGCNFHCNFCQNHAISQCSPESRKNASKYTSSEIAVQAKKTPGSIGIAYTYNEPVVFYEYMLDTAIEAHNLGLKNVMISNGFIQPEPLDKLLPFIDAFNIDLKAFSNKFYTKYAKGKLDPVLKTLESIVNAGKHLEITNLVITDANDGIAEFEKMTQWISSTLGKDIPLHISRYFPVYKLNNPATPISTMERFYRIAKNNLYHVYLGNVFDEQRSNTYCPNCSAVLIERKRYATQILGIYNAECSLCNHPIKIVS